MYEIFEQLLQKYNISSYKVAKDIGIRQSTLSNWKTKRSIISPEIGKKIADYFGVSLDYLMTGKESPVEKESPITDKEKRYIAYAMQLMKDEISLEKLQRLVDAAGGGLKED